MPRKKRNRITEATKRSSKQSHYFEAYGLDDKLVDERFNVNLAKEMNGKELSMDYIKTSGFKQPLVFRQSDGLDMKMPSEGISGVDQIGSLIGKDMVIPVEDVTNSTTIFQTMSEFCEYFKSKDRKNIYNVLSLEFSFTELDEQVERPSVINQFDWIECFFPRELKDEEGDNYPLIQKYCLMSAANSFTTFHIDFGGTSVWYHVLKGCKVFWLIEPNKKNLEIYEKYYKNKTSLDVFFGDLVEKCQRVTLTAGNTFLMPSGWIHAVYTPEDSIVFGGNFTHSLAVEMQLKISEMEKRLKTPTAQRFPLEINLYWFVIEDLVFMKTGKSFLFHNFKRLNQEKDKDEDFSLIGTDGMKMLVDHLSHYLSEQIEGITDVKELWFSAVDILGMNEKYSSLLVSHNKIAASPSSSSENVSAIKHSIKRTSSSAVGRSSKKQRPTQTATRRSTRKRFQSKKCDQ